MYRQETEERGAKPRQARFNQPEPDNNPEQKTDKNNKLKTNGNFFNNIIFFF